MGGKINWTIYTQWTLLFDQDTKLWTPAQRQQEDIYTEEWQPWRDAQGKAIAFYERDSAVNFLYGKMR